jgi:hypothetical protein
MAAVLAVALARWRACAGCCCEAMPSHTWAPVETARAHAVTHQLTVVPSVHHHHWAATLSDSLQLPQRRQVVCDARGGDPVQPRRCQVHRRLATGHCGAAAFDSAILNQPGWRSSRGIATRRRGRAGGRRRGARGSGAVQLVMGGGSARAPRSRWALGAHRRAGPSRDFYSITSRAILTRVCCPGGYQGVWSGPGWLHTAMGSPGPLPAA